MYHLHQKFSFQNEGLFELKKEYSTPFHSIQGYLFYGLTERLHPLLLQLSRQPQCNIWVHHNHRQSK